VVLCTDINILLQLTQQDRLLGDCDRELIVIENLL